MSMNNKAQKVLVKKDQVLCRQEDQSYDLYFVLKGKLLVCTRSGRMVTPIAYLEDNQYFGEMSFIDKLPRSADVIAMEETELLQIPNDIMKKNFPTWLLIMAKSMTNKLRNLDEVISSKGIKRKNVQTVQPLAIEDQRHYYQLLEQDS